CRYCADGDRALHRRCASAALRRPTHACRGSRRRPGGRSRAARRVILASGVDDVTREGARRAAEQELLDRRYGAAQPPLVQRLIGRAIREFVRLLNRAAGGGPGGRLGLLVIAVVLETFVGGVVV